MAWESIAEIKRANEAIGHHWFERDTLRFFRSRVLSRVYGGRFFVSSERYSDDTPRLYTVRIAYDDGRIDTVGQFQGYRTARQAQAAARILAGE